MPTPLNPRTGDRRPSLNLDFDLDLPEAKFAELQTPSANDLVLDLTNRFLITTARVVMQVGDDSVPEKDRATIRRFWFRRPSVLRIRNDRGAIVVASSTEHALRVIDFEVLVA